MSDTKTQSEIMRRAFEMSLTPIQRKFAELAEQGYRVKYDRVRGLHMVKDEPNPTEKGATEPK